MSILNIKTVKMFGIDPLIDKCSGRKGIVEINDKDGIGWRPFAYLDAERKQPKVLECEHDAIGMVAAAAADMFAKAAAASNPLNVAYLLQTLPRPEDFRYVYIDQEPEGLDTEITDTTQAHAVIAETLAKLTGGAA